MSDKIAQEFALDPLAILGFGFVGLAFLMAILGYRALNQVIAAPNPKENVIKLARLFMYLSLALLIAAGPLQLALLWAQNAFAPKPVNLKISLINSGWDAETFGKVFIIKDGEPEPLERMKPVSRAVANGAVLQLQMEEVIDKIEKMQAQILVVTKESERMKVEEIALPALPDPATLAQQGG
ncbi:MAG: hypothetical protein WCC66_16245 [Rhizobiaceae bacterium]